MFLLFTTQSTKLEIIKQSKSEMHFWGRRQVLQYPKWASVRTSKIFPSDFWRGGCCSLAVCKSSTQQHCKTSYKHTCHLNLANRKENQPGYWDHPRKDQLSLPIHQKQQQRAAEQGFVSAKPSQRISLCSSCGSPPKRSISGEAEDQIQLSPEDALFIWVQHTVPP